jgi:hypothetical protein
MGEVAPCKLGTRHLPVQRRLRKGVRWPMVRFSAICDYSRTSGSASSGTPDSVVRECVQRSWCGEQARRRQVSSSSAVDCREMSSGPEAAIHLDRKSRLPPLECVGFDVFGALYRSASGIIFAATRPRGAIQTKLTHLQHYLNSRRE